MPRAWPVVDLAQHPTACVRFDRHAVYLGHPGTTQDCPSRPLGRTGALLIEPASNLSAEQGTVRKPIDREYSARAARVTITATYDTDAALVEQISSGAQAPAAAPRSAQRPSAAAALPATATNFTGKGFDACTAPSSSAMSDWQANSPYSAVGIYIGGPSRGCSQPNLTSGWVQQQASAGWRFIPLYAGPQAASITSPAAQGTSAADDAISDATALGFGVGSTLYYDIEAYSSTYTTKVLGAMSAWTQELHSRGFHSGVYSSSSSGIADLADNYQSYSMPDVIFDALWNNAADTADPAANPYWANHQRIHQYGGQRTETYGNTTLAIDQDYLDVQLTTSTTTPGTHGMVWDRSRPTGGPWQTNATQIDTNDGINAVAAAALPDGTMHVEALLNGQIWDRTRSAAGVWSNSSVIDTQGAITDLAVAALPDGTLHVEALVNGQIWDRTRSAAGVWSNATEIDAGGAVTDIAAAGLSNGDLHVEAIVNGSIYDRVRKGTTGNWSVSTAIDTNGNINDVSASSTPNAELHVQALVNGQIYDRVRSNGTWTNSLIDAGGAVTQMSSTGLPNGDLHVEAVVNGQVYDRVRNGTTTNWGVSTQIDGNGAIFGTYAAGTTDGTLHVGTNA